MEQGLTLHRDEHDAHSVVEWPDRKLQLKQKEYLILHNDETLLPRQREQVNRILGKYVFEMYSRGQDRIKQARIIKGLEETGELEPTC